ncbi:MAG: amidase [Paludibaculum sp.]
MASIPPEVFTATAVELNQRLVRKDFTAVELTRAFLDRMESQGRRTLALVLKDHAHQRARDVDRELKRDRIRGPLQGVPFCVEDSLSVARHPTTWGSRIFAGQVFDSNAAVVERLGKSGAVLAAKTNARELGGAGRLMPGNSCAAAKAVAEGLAPYALGVEAGGSLLVPAGDQRLCILKPTYGLVSRFGAVPVSWTLDRIAIIARSAEDCGQILHVLAGGDDRDAGSSGKSFHYALPYVPPVSSFRIGFVPSEFSEPQAAPLRAVLDLLKASGATLVEVRLPDLPYEQAARTLQAAESSAAFADIIGSGTVDSLADPGQAEGLRAGLEVTAVQYLTAGRVRRQVQEAMNQLLGPLDLLITPAYSGHRENPPGGGGASTPGRSGGMTPHIAATDLAGLPVLALPGPRGVPSVPSISLIAKANNENVLLQAAHHLQSQTDWHRNRSLP